MPIEDGVAFDFAVALNIPRRFHKGIVPVQNNLWDQYTGDQFIVLAPNEGLAIANLTAMGSAGVVRFYFNIEFATASAF